MRAKTAQSKSPSKTFGEQIAAARAAKSWSQQDLADAMEKIGHPIDRTVILRIERGSRKNVTLDEVMALCASVGLSPVHAIVPWDDAAVVAVAPNVHQPAEVVRAWFVGASPLPITSHRDVGTRFALRVPDEVYQFMQPKKEKKG